MFGSQKNAKYDPFDRLWLPILAIAALFLFTINLGGLPLRDWDEGTVAQVAREIYRAAPGSLTWLFPTLGGEPYLNKPPLMHGLMAIAYKLGGINEFTSRLPGALLTAFSVPLLYLAGRELFARHLPALLAALVYLTFLPVVRNGRLAMLDGAVLCFSILMLWCVLRSRRDSRFALGIGIGFGLICLTKGVMLGLLMGAIALLFLLWDTPRILQQPYLWMGMILGSAPVALWYSMQWWHYGSSFLGGNLVNQSFRRIWASVEKNEGPPWYYLLELLKYSAPWLLFLPLAFRHTWHSLTLGWAKLVLLWSSIYFVAISLMATKLPWYILPLYPALAMVVGAQLTRMWEQGIQPGIRQYPQKPYSVGWVFAFGMVAIATLLGCLYFVFWSSHHESDVAAMLAAVSIIMAVSAILLARQDPQFISVMIWGFYVVLMMLMLSGHWVWELAEAYPVKPVAAMVQQHTPPGETLYTSYGYRRPSLDFYSDRQVLPASRKKMRQLLQNEPQFYLLIDANALQSLQLPNPQILDTVAGWVLVKHEVKG